MKYEEMSDFEVNKKVAGIFLPCDYLFDEKNERVELANYQDVMIGDMHDQVLTPYQEFNPCSNPSDAWPIIVENGIGTCPHSSKWMANNFNPSEIGYQVQIIHYDKNPLRAAMICFLKMKDAESNAN